MEGIEYIEDLRERANRFYLGVLESFEGRKRGELVSYMGRFRSALANSKSKPEYYIIMTSITASFAARETMGNKSYPERDRFTDGILTTFSFDDTEREKILGYIQRARETAIHNLEKELEGKI
jgi:hypothetical protein